MSMVPLTITSETATLEMKAYTMPVRTRKHATSGVVTRGGVLTVGDRLELPSELVVMVELSADTLPEATALAYATIAVAENAVTVSTYEGTQAVAALLGYNLDTRLPDSARLTLRWAPAGPDRGALPLPGDTTFTWDATSPDWSSTTPSWDATA